MSEIYCKYCHTTWKYKKDYEKHVACCEYFYHFRRNPVNEMDDYGGKLPTQKELFRFVQELSLKCSRLEQDVARLKSSVSTRHKKVIVDCLNHPEQLPEYTFIEWWKHITLHIIPIETAAEIEDRTSHWSSVDNPYLFRVFRRDLIEGIKYLLHTFIKSSPQNKKPPIRCFTQKSGVFYIYTGNAESWRIMTGDDFETMIDGISQLFVREYLNWQRTNHDNIGQKESRIEDQMLYLTRVNTMRPSKERGMTEIRKWLYSILEENAKTEFEFV